MLRVLTLSTLFPDSSRPNFGVFVERQTLGLAAMPDVAVQVVAPVGMPPGPLSRLRHGDKRALPARESWKGLEVYRPRFASIPGSRGRFHSAFLIRALRPVLDTIRDRFPFDVIDASFFFPDGPAAVALGKRYGVPVSIKARGADIHHWGRAQTTAAQVIEAAHGTDAMLAVSAAMRNYMIALGMPGDRIRVHYTGVDLDRFHPLADPAVMRSHWGLSGPLVLSVGALIPRKGHRIVIEAVARLPGVQLAIVGDGPDRAALTTLADSLGISDRVRLLGPIAHADIPALLGAADVMALASASEGLANVWLEALACGTPIVITAAGGAREVVTASDAGCIVARDADSFAAGIADVVRRSPDRHRVRAFAERFTWAANSEALAAHLQALVPADRHGGIVPA